MKTSHRVCSLLIGLTAFVAFWFHQGGFAVSATFGALAVGGCGLAILASGPRRSAQVISAVARPTGPAQGYTVSEYISEVMSSAITDEDGVGEFVNSDGTRSLRTNPSEFSQSHFEYPEWAATVIWYPK